MEHIVWPWVVYRSTTKVVNLQVRTFHLSDTSAPTCPTCTPPKTNMSPKKGLFQYEIHLPTIDFQGTFVRFPGSKMMFKHCWLHSLSLAPVWLLTARHAVEKSLSDVVESVAPHDWESSESLQHCTIRVNLNNILTYRTNKKPDLITVCQKLILLVLYLS